MTKPLIIFGAGASGALRYMTKGHLSSPKLYPPLTNELFDDRFIDIIGRYDLIKERLPQIKYFVAQNKSLEMFLYSLLTDGTEVSKRQLIETQIYLQDLFDCISKYYIDDRFIRANQYVLFLRELQNIYKNATIVSFNYDLFLDFSMKHVFNYDYVDMNSYFGKDYELFKIHGSVDWGYSWKYKRLDTIEEKVNFIINSSNKPKLNPTVINRHKQYENFISPALAIPLHKDKDFIVAEHHIELIKRMKKTNSVIIIGWSAGDKYFTELMKKNLNYENINLSVVSLNNPGKIIENIVPKGLNLKNKPKKYKESFSSLVENREKLIKIIKNV